MGGSMARIYDYPILYFYGGNKEPDKVDFISKIDQDIERITGESGIEGLRLDFNSGLRISVPSGNWHIRIQDYDSGKVFFDGMVSEKTLISMEKYFIRWQIEIFFRNELVFSHVLDLTGQTVRMDIPPHSMGDIIMLLPYIRAFQKKHHCQIVVKAWEIMHPIVREYYPDFELYDENSPQESYATYYLGAYLQDYWFLICDDSRHLPVDHIPRLVLDLPEMVKGELWHPTVSRQIREPYVCIAVQASNICKSWLYPGGWDQVVDYLKKLGYRVLCIDRDKCMERDGYRISMPEQAEDFTGNHSLIERINLLAYGDFFIGLGSGLSWLAHAAGCPVVLISGMSMPHAEFDTPYRVMNRLVCHGCYNDLNVNWKEVLCPYHNGTDREMECTKKISPRQVITAIDRLREDIDGGRV